MTVAVGCDVEFKRSGYTLARYPNANRPLYARVMPLCKPDEVRAVGIFLTWMETNEG